MYQRVCVKQTSVETSHRVYVCVCARQRCYERKESEKRKTVSGIPSRYTLSTFFVYLFFCSLFALTLDGSCCCLYWLVVASVSVWLKGKRNKQVRFKLKKNPEK